MEFPRSRRKRETLGCKEAIGSLVQQPATGVCRRDRVSLVWYGRARLDDQREENEKEDGEKKKGWHCHHMLERETHQRSQATTWP